MSRFWIINSLSDITFKILDGYKKPYQFHISINAGLWYFRRYQKCTKLHFPY